MSNEEREKANERRRMLRANKSEEEKKKVCEVDKDRKKKERDSRGEVVKEFEKISFKHKKRKIRNEKTCKEKLQENLKSKKGMRLLREEGRLREYTERIEQNSDEKVDWENFMKKSKKHTDMAEKARPDIVKRINEESRKTKERLREKDLEEEKIREKKIQEDGGEWIFNAEFGEYSWIGEKDPPIFDPEPDYEPLSENDLKHIREQEEKWLEASIEEQQERARERRHQKNEKLRAAMNIPIVPNPEKELCEYEKLRMRIIKEREQAMAESGFFDDLIDYKKRIGLLK